MGTSLPPAADFRRILALSVAERGQAIANLGLPSLVNFREDNTRKLRATLAKVRLGDARAKILCLGDSTTNGSGAGSGDNYNGARPRSYPVALAKALNDRERIAAHANTLTGSQGLTGFLATFDPSVTIGAGWGAGGSNVLGGQSLNNSSTTNPIAKVVADPFDTVDIYYLRAAGLGTFTVNRDGGSTLATVDCSFGSGSLMKATVSTTLAAGTLNIQRSAGGTVALFAVDIYNSAAKSASVFNAGKSGGLAADFVGSANYYSPTLAQTYFAADVTIAKFGINDATAGTSEASFKASLGTIIATAQGFGTAILTVPHARDAAVAAIAVQDAFNGYLYDLAAQYDCPLIDLRRRFGTYADLTALGLMYDSTHPKAPVYDDEGRAVARAVAAA